MRKLKVSNYHNASSFILGILIIENELYKAKARIKQTSITSYLLNNNN